MGRQFIMAALTMCLPLILASCDSKRDREAEAGRQAEVARQCELVNSALAVVRQRGRKDLTEYDLGQPCERIQSDDLAIPSASGLLSTDLTTTTLFTTGSQVTTGSAVLDVNGVLVPNAATSGAVAQAPTTAAISSVAIVGSQGEVIEPAEDLP